MVDYQRLREAYNNESFYILQLEVGDVCGQGCSYCSMNALEQPTNTLTDEQIRSVLDESHEMGIAAVKWLGGEPLLRTGQVTPCATIRDPRFPSLYDNLSFTGIAEREHDELVYS